MNQPGKTPNDIAGGPTGDTLVTEGSNPGISTVDRIALVAMFSVAILILVLFELTSKSGTRPMPVAATVAMSSYVGLPVSLSDRRMPSTARKDH